jgi:hypothetical protein
MEAEIRLLRKSLSVCRYVGMSVFGVIPQETRTKFKTTMLEIITTFNP